MYLWDGMHQTISMNHVHPPLAREYIRTFLQFQQPNGHLCSTIIPPLGADAHSCSTDAQVPNVAMALWDNYQQDPDKDFLREAFPKLEKYIEWDREYGKGPNPSIKYLLKWGDAGDAGMDVSTGRLPTTTHATRTRHGNLLTVCVVVPVAQHEQNFCPGGTYWHKGDGQWGTQCSADHYALDFANYIIWEAQTLTKMATELGLKPRADYWIAVGLSSFLLY